MHENSHRISAQDIPYELSGTLFTQPDSITELVINEVTQYNKTLLRSRSVEGNMVDTRLMREAEEEADKVFLDKILDIMEHRIS